MKKIYNKYRELFKDYRLQYSEKYVVLIPESEYKSYDTFNQILETIFCKEWNCNYLVCGEE